MYLVERNYDLETKKVFRDKNEAIEYAKKLANQYSNDYINVAILDESMETIWKNREKY